MKNLLLLLFSCLLAWSTADAQDASDLMAVRIQLEDEDNRATAARVRITNLTGQYFAPVGHTVDFPLTFSRDQTAFEQDVMLANDRRFAYVDGSFRVHLPSDNDYRIEVVKGFSYQIIDDTFHVNQGPQSHTFQLVSMFDLTDRGWYSGDVHVHHINAESALLEMKAEDLNVCNILISDFTKDHERYRGSIEPISDPEHLIFYGQEYRENRLGHINLLNITERMVQPAKIMRPHQFPLNTDIADEVHAQGGHISWAHFAAWPGLEGPMGLVLQKVDAIELLCTIDPFQSPIFAADVVPELPLNSGLRLWYRLLNCGLQVPITAGTDKMGNLVTVGANRVFAKVDSAFNYANWIEALNAGRTFVSNTPFLLFEINDHVVGDALSIAPGDTLNIRASVWSQFPVHFLEVIANGEVIASQSIAEGESGAQIKVRYSPSESTWLAARAYRQQTDYLRQGVGMSERRNLSKAQTELNHYFGTLRPEVPFAHSSPIYIYMGERPIYHKDDVDYFVRYLDNVKDWLQQQGDFPSEAARSEVLAKFAEGRDAFEALHR